MGCSILLEDTASPLQSHLSAQTQEGSRTGQAVCQGKQLKLGETILGQQFLEKEVTSPPNLPEVVMQGELVALSPCFLGVSQMQ